MQRPLRILYVTAYYKPAYAYGGPVRSDSALCEGLVRAGAEVSVFTTNANGEALLDVPSGVPLVVDGVTVWYFPLAWRGNFFYSPALAAACAAQVPEFDLAVLGCLWTHGMGPGVAACRRAGVPYVVPLRGQLLPWALKHKRWKKRIYMALLGRRYLDGAVALHCTDHLEAEAVAALGSRPPLFVVPNGVDTVAFEHLPERGGLRKRLAIPPDAVVLLFLGRLHRKKRPDIAIETLAALQSAPREVHLVLAGPDEERLMSRLQGQAQRLGCACRAHLVGLLRGNQILEAFADADLLVMPSEVQESFGMSAAEALAAGVPVLVSEGVPVGGWAQEANAGRVVPCSGGAFAEAARELVSAPAQLKAMGERGRRLARERFDLPVIAREMLAQYRTMVTTGKPLPQVTPIRNHTRDS